MTFSNAVSSPQMPLTPITPSSACRFIPSRQRQSTPWHEHCARKLFDGIRERRDRTDKPPNFNDDHLAANRRLLAAIFETYVTPRLTKILQFRTPLSTHENIPASLWNDFNRNRELPDRIASPRRHISSTPERVLDSPDLVDDYYLNLLHWSAQNVIAVALSDCVYTWHAATATTTLLTSTSNPRDSVTSLRWSDDGSTLAIGTNSSSLQIWDVASRRNIRTIQGHEGRVSVSAWKQRSRHVVTTGSRDNTIKQHDIRQANATTMTLDGHSQEVCGLQWSPDGTQLASGSNDNLAKVWDANAMSSGRPPRLTLDKHVAAVKAIAWCPWQSRLLATGGGTADRCIRFWNSSDGVCLGGVDTQSQVCGLVWSEHDKELLSAHGFSKNQLTIWSYPHMARVADLVGHSARVLHLTLSPDSTTVCSASADETLRLWKVFRPAPERKRAITSQQRSKKRGLLRTLEFR